MTTKEKPSKELADNRFVKALIDRLVSNEKLIQTLREELGELREQLAEQCAWLMPDGRVRFKGVLRDNSDGCEVFDVFLMTQEVKPVE